VEPFAGDRVEENLNPVGLAYYGFSTLLCTPASLSQEVGLALRAQAGEAASAGRRAGRVHAPPPRRRDAVQPRLRSEAMTATSHEVEAARAIERAVLDYFEGWFDGDAARMERALHPELAKRPGRVDDVTEEPLGTLTAAEMIARTAEGVGRTRDVTDRLIEVEVVDVFGDIATAVVRSAVYHEYLHLVRTAAGWKIVNALWQWMPGHERGE